MKDVLVILKVKVNDDCPIEEVVNSVQVDAYGLVEEVVSVEAHEVVEKFVSSEDDPSDMCAL